MEAGEHLFAVAGSRVGSADVRELLDRDAVEPTEARGFVEQLALCLQGSVLLQAGSPLAAAFCRSRLGGAHGLAMGTLSADLPFADIIERALPTAV